MAKVRQLLIGLASSSALYSSLTPALGLGDITLHSALSQPLDAEIELLDVGDLSADEMRVRLAPAEVFSRSGVDRQYFFNDFRFTPVLRPGKNVIRVVSTQPVREPYLNFIVEVVRPNGQLYREYTLLLDPPSSAAYRSLDAVPAASVQTARTASPARVSAPAVLPAAQLGGTYTVASGDSLWKIANRLTGATQQGSQQALMNDLYALNPHAFINGDISRLRAGAQLLLPDRVASVVPAAEPTATAPLQGTLVVTESAPQVSSELSADPAAQPLIQEQSRLEQELANQTAETLQLQQSLAELGLQVQQLQQQMATRDQQIAGLQAELAARRATAPAPVATVSAAAVDVAPVAVEQGTNWLAIAAGLLALLLAAIAGVFWRGRRPAGPAPAPIGPPDTQTNTQSTAVAVVPSEVALSVREAPRGGPMWPAEGEDALQSANVYIAYGRVSEAASVLRKAWAAQPQRSDIAFRLLEVLALLGDVQGFAAQESVLRDSGFTPARIDELKARHAELFNNAAPASVLEDVVLQLDEPEAKPSVAAANDAQLNLDDLSLDADWDLVSPFAPAMKNKTADKSTSHAADKHSPQERFELPGGRDAGSPFAESMLVEETSHDDWSGDELNMDFLDEPESTQSMLLGDLDYLDDNRSNLTKLNTALAYIEQGSLDSACQILNEVISEGDEQEKQEARQLLAKIA